MAAVSAFAAAGAIAFAGPAMAAPPAETSAAPGEVIIMAWGLHSTHPTQAQCEATGQELQRSGQYRHYLCLASGDEWNLWVHP